MSLLVEAEYPRGPHAEVVGARMSWPITDLSFPLASLLGHACADLQAWMDITRVEQATPVRWSLGQGFVGTGQGFTLVAELDVRSKTGIATTEVDPDDERWIA